jgi:hypothetical protein
VTVAFLACVEAGPLEAKTCLLARSLRRWGGRLAGAPFYAFQPRAGQPLAPATLECFRTNGVVFVDQPLNQRFANFGLANKIYACAYAEQTAAEEVLVFLDSDTVITSEPAALTLAAGIDAAVRPVDFGGAGAERGYVEGSDYWRTHFRRPSSTGPPDPLDGYWLRLYALFGLGDPGWYVEATLDRLRIRAWFNSGLVAVRRAAGLFGQWRDDFEAIAGAGLLPPDGRVHYTEQLALATALTRVRDRVTILPATYNYPLSGRAMQLPPLREAGLEKLVHIHYNRYFQIDGYLRSVDPPLDLSHGVGRWLDAQLPLHPIDQEAPLFDDAALLPEGVACN